MGRRARGLVLLGAAAACAGFAASSVSRYTNDVSARVGPLVPVVVARADVPRGTAIGAATGQRSFAIRRVPVRFAPSQALSSISQALGYRTAVALRRGDYVTDSILAAGGGAASRTGGHGRVVEVPVAGARFLSGALRPGSRVDVLITTERAEGLGRTYLALQDAELMAFSAPGEVGAEAGARATAALRVSLRQAVLLTAAQNFARELRLVPRRDGDRRRLGAVGVAASGLG